MSELYLITVYIGVRGGGSGGYRPHGSKNFRASTSGSKILNGKKCFNRVRIFRTTVFQGKRMLLKNPDGKKYIQYSEKFQGKRKLLKNPER